MLRISIAVRVGARAYVVAFLLTIACSYVTCLLDGVEYNWAIALPKILKGCSVAGIGVAILQYLASGIEPKQ